MGKNINFVCRILLFAAIFMTSSCATGQKTAAFLNASTHINQVISAYGPPTNVISTHDGGSVYVWSASNTQTYSIPQYGSQNYYGYAGQYLGSSYGQTGYSTQTYTALCEVRVLVDSSGYILNRSLQGNSCP